MEYRTSTVEQIREFSQSSLDFEILDPAIVPSQKREEFVKCGQFPVDGHRFTPWGDRGNHVIFR